MEKRYLLDIKDSQFLFLFKEELQNSVILDMKSFYKIQPSKVIREESGCRIQTTSFMDVNLQEELIVRWEADSLYCKGEIADYGVIEGRAEIYHGLTPYETMMNEVHEGGKDIPVRTEEEIHQAVDELLSRMTLEEKIGQMSQSAGEDVSAIGSEIEAKPMLEQIEASEIGSLIYIGCSPENVYAYQKLAVEKSRLGIPLLICQDVIHGFQTIFPIPLAQSCSFDMELIRSSAAVAAREASSAGIMCAFSPMLDLSRDPRWGRVCEGTGEDPFLGSQIARAWVQGFQGKCLDDKETVAACLKHFIGYAACEAGRDYNTVEISEHTLYNMYLPAFIAGVEEGAAMVMSSFNVMNGIPVAANREILKGLLRDRIGFDGIVITDYAAVKEVGIHGCCDDNQEITRRVAEATIDIEMATSFYNFYLPQLVENGKIPMDIIDNAVSRILTLKYRLGIMDDPYRYIQPQKAKKIIYSDAHLETAKKMAEESMVLLKNNGILPIDDNKKIALIGPCGDSKDMLGAWQFSEYKDQCVTIREGLEKAGYSVTYAKGCEIEREIPGGIEEAVRATRQADIIIVAVGESSGMSGEATSRMNITLPSVQEDLLKALSRLGKPLVVILTNGRPLLLNHVADCADAVLETWFLGAAAGEAIAEILSGKVSPSGKLTMSFPTHTGQIPVYYNHYRTGRPYLGDGNRFTSSYLDGENEPLYSFGYGLTYTDFCYDELMLERKELQSGESLTVSIALENTGKRQGTEVVQLYLSDVSASVVRPVKELKGFQRVTLEPGEKRRVEFEITESMLKFYDAQKEYRAEKGQFMLWIGSSSRDQDLLQESFIYTD